MLFPEDKKIYPFRLNDKENTELFYEYKLLISKGKKITHFLFIVIKYWCIYAMYLF